MIKVPIPPSRFRDFIVKNTSRLCLTQEKPNKFPAILPGALTKDKCALLFNGYNEYIACPVFKDATHFVLTTFRYGNDDRAVLLDEGMTNFYAVEMVLPPAFCAGSVFDGYLLGNVFYAHDVRAFADEHVGGKGYMLRLALLRHCQKTAQKVSFKEKDASEKQLQFQCIPNTFLPKFPCMKPPAPDEKSSAKTPLGKVPLGSLVPDSNVIGYLLRPNVDHEMRASAASAEGLRLNSQCIRLYGRTANYFYVPVSSKDYHACLEVDARKRLVSRSGTVCGDATSVTDLDSNELYHALVCTYHIMSDMFQPIYKNGASVSVHRSMAYSDKSISHVKKAQVQGIDVKYLQKCVSLIHDSGDVHKLQADTFQKLIALIPDFANEI